MLRSTVMAIPSLLTRRSRRLTRQRTASLTEPNAPIASTMTAMVISTEQISNARVHSTMTKTVLAPEFLATTSMLCRKIVSSMATVELAMTAVTFTSVVFLAHLIARHVRSEPIDTTQLIALPLNRLSASQTARRLLRLAATVLDVAPSATPLDALTSLPILLRRPTALTPKSTIQPRA
jgi:hypothetical protein